MQLLQIRGFNEFFQDTFAFIKQNGKHYFKHYFIINGFFLVLLAAMSYIFLSFYSSVLFNPSSFVEGSINENQLDNFMNDNFGLFIIGLIAFIIIVLFAGIVSYAYTPIYLKLYNENNGKNFSTKEIINTYKNNIGKLLMFVLLGILIGIPLSIVMGLSVFVLAITIVGMLLIPLVIGAFTLLYNNTLLEYLHKKRNFWDAMSYSWTLITSKFWHAVGCVGIFYIMSSIIQFAVQITSTLFMTARSLTAVETSDNPFEQPASVIIVMAGLFIVQFVASILMNNMIQISQGIIYFSLKEEKENINTKDVIDQIGEI